MPDGLRKSTTGMNFIRRFESEVTLYEEVTYTLEISYGSIVALQSVRLPLNSPRSYGRGKARDMGRKALMRWVKQWRRNNPVGSKTVVRGLLIMEADKFVKLYDNSVWQGGSGREYWAYGPYNIRGHREGNDGKTKR